MRYLLFFICVLACAAPEATKRPAPREHLRGMISGYEQGPTRARLNAVPGDVVAELMALASDPSEKRFYRARAITALGLYPEEERAYQFLSLTVQQTSTGLLERSSAVYALSSGFGATHRDEVVSLITPLLQSELPLLQKAATETLKER
jgi:hypothetical protein